MHKWVAYHTVLIYPSETASEVMIELGILVGGGGRHVASNIMLGNTASCPSGCTTVLVFLSGKLYFYCVKRTYYAY